MTEIYFKTLSKMDNEFSTRTFNAKAIKLGLPIHKTYGDTRTFLLKECDNLPNQLRMWRKTDFNKNNDLTIFDIEIDVDDAINLLKSKGYKILKPREIQYEEL